MRSCDRGPNGPQGELRQRLIDRLLSSPFRVDLDEHGPGRVARRIPSSTSRLVDAEIRVRSVAVTSREPVAHALRRSPTDEPNERHAELARDREERLPKRLVREGRVD